MLLLVSDEENVDYSVFPDVDVLPPLDSDSQRAEYAARVCAAWDFGTPPEPRTFALFSMWRDVFDRYPIVSPAYAAFRTWFGWPMVVAPRLADSDRSIAIASFERS